MDKIIFESNSGDLRFLIFQDRMNGLWRFLYKMKIPLELYVRYYKRKLEKEEKNIKEGPEYYESGNLYFTKHEALLGLEFIDNYTGGTGNDASFFPRYFYSSIVVLAISILESLLKNLIVSVEKETGNKWKHEKNKLIFMSGIDYLNDHGYSYNLGKYKKRYIKLNEIRKFFIHYLHKEDIGELSKEELKKYDLKYETVRKHLITISEIAKILENHFYY